MANLKQEALAAVESIAQDWVKYLSDRHFVEIEDLYESYQDETITATDAQSELVELVNNGDQSTEITSVGEFLDWLEVLSEHDSKVLTCLEP